ncbi:hypothetical protein NIES4101_71960 [Calothrix sp. NIES-4101]|nr:hypothetical protein NIES4101_71960 [Calothrix sp. NIES-4101]
MSLKDDADLSLQVILESLSFLDTFTIHCIDKENISVSITGYAMLHIRCKVSRQISVYTYKNNLNLKFLITPSI